MAGSYSLRLAYDAAVYELGLLYATLVLDSKIGSLPRFTIPGGLEMSIVSHENSPNPNVDNRNYRDDMVGLNVDYPLPVRDSNLFGKNNYRVIPRENHHNAYSSLPKRQRVKIKPKKVFQAMSIDKKSGKSTVVKEFSIRPHRQIFSARS